MISAVVFDLDDTLADATGVHERVWPAVVDTILRHVPGVPAEAFLARYDGVMEGHYTRLLHGEVDFLGFRRQRLAEALEPWAEVADELFEAYLAVKARVVDELRAQDDAVATLRALRAAGVKVGVLTNGPGELQRRKLAVTGLDAEVDAIAISGEIGAHKPAAAAFAAALDLLGCSAGAAAMVGDSVANDVIGALGHGFAHVVWYGRDARPDLPAGVHCARRLADVPQLLGLAGTRPSPARAGA